MRGMMRDTQGTIRDSVRDRGMVLLSSQDARYTLVCEAQNADCEGGLTSLEKVCFGCHTSNHEPRTTNYELRDWGVGY